MSVALSLIASSQQYQYLLLIIIITVVTVYIPAQLTAVLIEPNFSFPCNNVFVTSDSDVTCINGIVLISLPPFLSSHFLPLFLTSVGIKMVLFPFCLATSSP